MKLSFKLVSCFLSAASAVSMSGGLYSIQSFANEETVTLSNGGLNWLCDESAAFYRIRVVRADETEEEVACFEWESTSIEDFAGYGGYDRTERLGFPFYVFPHS